MAYYGRTSRRFTSSHRARITTRLPVRDEMFGRDTQKDDARGLLSHDTIGDDDIVWEHEQNSMRSDRDTTASMSEVWHQDPLSETTDHHHNYNPSSSSARVYAPPNPPPLPEDHGEAAHELDAEFQRIFSPVSLPQTNPVQFCMTKLISCQKGPERPAGEGAILPRPRRSVRGLLDTARGDTRPPARRRDRHRVALARRSTTTRVGAVCRSNARGRRRLDLFLGRDGRAH